MKTILSQLARVMGVSVLSHLGLIGGGPTESTVGAYLALKLSKDGIDPEAVAQAKENDNGLVCGVASCITFCVVWLRCVYSCSS